MTVETTSPDKGVVAEKPAGDAHLEGSKSAEQESEPRLPDIGKEKIERVSKRLHLTSEEKRHMAVSLIDSKIDSLGAHDSEQTETMTAELIDMKAFIVGLDGAEAERLGLSLYGLAEKQIEDITKQLADRTLNSQIRTKLEADRKIANMAANFMSAFSTRIQTEQLEASMSEDQASRKDSAQLQVLDKYVDEHNARISKTSV